MFRNTAKYFLFGIFAFALAACGGHGGALPNTDAIPDTGISAVPDQSPAGDLTTMASTSTAYLSSSASVLPAGYTPTSGIDAYTPSFKWVTTQSSSEAAKLLSYGVYTDIYASSIREVANPSYGPQPAYSSVNLREDAFQHSADPATLTYQPGSGSVTLHWKPDSRGYVTIGGYTVYKGTSAGTLSKVATLSSSATTYTLGGLTNGSTYYVAIKSIIGGSEVPYSWTETAVPGTTSTHLDSPSVSVSGTIAPGNTVTLTVSAHVSGTLPSSMHLQTIVKPSSPTQTPTSVSMSYLGSGVYRGSVSVAIPSGFYGGVAYRVVGSTGGQLPYPSGTYYITSPNNRIHFGRYANQFTMNVASPAWQSFLAGYINKVMAGGGYKGTMLDDNINVFIRVRPDAYPPGYSDAAYPSQVSLLYKYLKGAVSSIYSISSNGFSSPQVASAVGPYVYGAEVEEFTADFAGTGYDSPTYWTTSMNNVLSIQATYPSLHFRLVTIGQEYNSSLRVYGLADYLLVANAHTDYDYDVHMGAWWPEENVSLGTPQQTFTNISQAYVSSTGAYERHFSNGMVIVNPSHSTLSPIAVPSGYKALVISGGDAQDGGKAYLSSVSSVTLGGDQAAVLVGSSLTGGVTTTASPAPTLSPTSTATSKTFSADAIGTSYSSQVFSVVSGVPSGLLMSNPYQGTSGGIGITVAANSTHTHGWLTATGAISDTNWPSGNYTVKYIIDGGNSNVTLTKVEILRVSANGQTVESVVGSASESRALASGTYTFSVPGAAQNANAGDILGVRFTVRNSTSSAQKFYMQVGSAGSSVQTLVH